MVIFVILSAIFLPPAGAVSGLAFARSNCATCHAVGFSDASPYSLAPPFRDLHKRYDVENLAEALAEGLDVGDTGHRQMPEVTLSPQEIDDFLAYLQWLEQGPIVRP